eukprot:8688084-Alexandrium_andersonii.AAC.1
MPEDEYWDEAFMGGEDGGENADGGRAAPPAPKRSRSGEKELKKVVPRRPMPSPPKKAAAEAAASDAVAKSERAGPPE